MWFRRSGRENLHPRVVSDFSRTLLLIEDPDSLQASVAVRLQGVFGPEAVLILQSEGHLGFAPGFDLGFIPGGLSGVRFERCGPLAKWLLTNEMPLIVERQPGVLESLDPNEKRLLARLRVAVCLPLLVLNRLPCTRMIGTRERGSGSPDKGGEK